MSSLFINVYCLFVTIIQEYDLTFFNFYMYYAHYQPLGCGWLINRSKNFVDLAQMTGKTARSIRLLCHGWPIRPLDLTILARMADKSASGLPTFER